jgi:hypothetical protein
MAIPGAHTNIRTSHGFFLRVGKEVIGTLQGWSPNQSRDVTPVYVLNGTDSRSNRGYPYDNVPGNVKGLTVNIKTVELYAKLFEEMFGFTDPSVMIGDQTKELDVLETWLDPQGGNRAFRYAGFWFTSIGRTVDSTGDRIINVSATGSYLYVEKSN